MTEVTAPSLLELGRRSAFPYQSQMQVDPNGPDLSQLRTRLLGTQEASGIWDSFCLFLRDPNKRIGLVCGNAREGKTAFAKTVERRLLRERNLGYFPIYVDLVKPRRALRRGIKPTMRLFGREELWEICQERDLLFILDGAKSPHAGNLYASWGLHAYQGKNRATKCLVLCRPDQTHSLEAFTGSFIVRLSDGIVRADMVSIWQMAPSTNFPITRPISAQEWPRLSFADHVIAREFPDRDTVNPCHLIYQLLNDRLRYEQHRALLCGRIEQMPLNFIWRNSHPPPNDHQLLSLLFAAGIYGSNHGPQRRVPCCNDPWFEGCFRAYLAAQNGQINPDEWPDRFVEYSSRFREYFSHDLPRHDQRYPWTQRRLGEGIASTASAFHVAWPYLATDAGVYRWDAGQLNPVGQPELAAVTAIHNECTAVGKEGVDQFWQLDLNAPGFRGVIPVSGTLSAAEWIDQEHFAVIVADKDGSLSLRLYDISEQAVNCRKTLSLNGHTSVTRVQWQGQAALGVTTVRGRKVEVEIRSAIGVSLKTWRLQAQRVAFAPYGTWIAAVSDGTICVHSVGEKLVELPRHEQTQNDVSLDTLKFSPNDRCLAWIDSSPAVRIWDLWYDRVHDIAIADSGDLYGLAWRGCQDLLVLSDRGIVTRIYVQEIVNLP